MIILKQAGCHNWGSSSIGGEEVWKGHIIVFQEGGIGCGVVWYNLTTSDSWSETLLKTLVKMGGGENSLGCRGMSVGTKSNSCCRFFGSALVQRSRMVLLMKNSLVSECSRRESILAWLVWLGVTSMRHMGSPEMVQIINLVIIAGTRVHFESTCVTACPTLQSENGR